MIKYKVGLCEKCKEYTDEGKAIVSCNPNTCDCDCHYEIDEMIKDSLERRKR